MVAPVALPMQERARMSITYQDKSVETLRTAVTTIDQQLAAVPQPALLRAAWAELVSVLALGPALGLLAIRPLAGRR